MNNKRNIHLQNNSGRAAAKSHFVTFVGPITTSSCTKLRALCCDLVSENNAEEITIMISSRGGALLEGFALYNFLQSLPVKLTMHNIGTVQSIANIVFLAADKRLSCNDTYFMLHGFDRTYKAERVAHRDLLEDTALMDREKLSFTEILKRRTRITDEDLKELKPFEKQIIVNTARAKKLGMIQKVEQVTIPKDAGLWNVEYKV